MPKRRSDAEIKEVLALRRTGLTLQAVADRYSLTPERIRQICVYAARMERKEMGMDWQAHDAWKRERGYQYD